MENTAINQVHKAGISALINSPIIQAYNAFNEAYKSGISALTELLKSHNNFIATNDRSADTIYAYDVWDTEIKELFVEGIRLDDGVIEIYLLSKRFDNKKWNWDKHTDDTWDTYWEGDSEGYWISLEHSEILRVFTLFNILECVQEYI